MKRGETKKPTISFKAPDEMKDWVKSFAKLHGVNESDLLREAVEIYWALRTSLSAREWADVKHKATTDEKPLSELFVKLLQPSIRSLRPPGK